jgi:anti-sigma factor RsiW
VGIDVHCAALEELASAWVDDALDKGDRARMAAHLERCTACRCMVDDLARTRMLLRSLPVRQVPVGLFLGEFGYADSRVSVHRRVAIQPRTGKRASFCRRTVIRLGEIGRLIVPSTRRRIAARGAAAFAVIAGLVGGTAFELGGQALPGAQLVQAPLDVSTSRQAPIERLGWPAYRWPDAVPVRLVWETAGSTFLLVGSWEHLGQTDRSS